MELADAERQLAVKLSELHRHAMLDPADPIHAACDFLVPSSPHAMLRWVEVNEFLRDHDRGYGWPTFLVAFASNGCNDYFAYDLRTDPPRVIYVDPDRPVAENLAALDRDDADKSVYASFAEWYADQLGRAK